MAGPYWVSVAVVVLMTVRNGATVTNDETVIDQHQLAPIVEEILKRYTPNYNGADDNSFPPMFSVAVSVPYNEDKYMYDMNEVPDDGEKVRKDILNCDVYKGDRVVAATVLRWPNVLKQCPDGRVKWTDVRKRCGKQQINSWADVERLCGKSEIQDGRADHAECRTLQHVNTLVTKSQKSKDDLMVFYVRASSCDKICTNPSHERNILSSIKKIMNWKNYVVVFSDVFKKCGGKTTYMDDLRHSLKRLGDAIRDQRSKLKDKRSNGLQYIFRCSPYSKQRKVECISCYNKSDDDIPWTCLSDGLQSGSKEGRGKQSGRKLSNKNIKEQCCVEQKQNQESGETQRQSKKKKRSNRTWG
ncbi:uncharacterized protein LOC120440718 [Oreochromis aureus]|uniref:uncharacterized protein LOC120440718 n=1 Tax=Oreochromis aureus TaxID=47969 RepID=UPI001954389C|nr:uncharacterized protein LOC120440718 [Oreochromis aureus]